MSVSLKRALLLLSVCLAVASNGLHANPNIVTSEKSSVEEVENETPKNHSVDFGWYLNMEYCGMVWTSCCCCGPGMSGDQISCEVPGYIFTCRPPGPFECSSDLGFCDGNPSECMAYCCSGGPIAGGGGNDQWGIFYMPMNP